MRKCQKAQMSNAQMPYARMSKCSYAQSTQLLKCTTAAIPNAECQSRNPIPTDHLMWTTNPPQVDERDLLQRLKYVGGDNPFECPPATNESSSGSASGAGSPRSTDSSSSTSKVSTPGASSTGASPPQQIEGIGAGATTAGDDSIPVQSIQATTAAQSAVPAAGNQQNQTTTTTTTESAPTRQQQQQQQQQEKARRRRRKKKQAAAPWTSPFAVILADKTRTFQRFDLHPDFELVCVASELQQRRRQQQTGAMPMPMPMPMPNAIPKPNGVPNATPNALASESQSQASESSVGDNDNDHSEFLAEMLGEVLDVYITEFPEIGCVG